MYASDNSSHNGSDIDIYKDFEEFNFENEILKLEGSKESYKQEAINLSERVKKLTEENEEFKKSNEVLKRNLSTLLKTAQTEVQRKDNVISELRTKVESFTFRRNKKKTNNKFTSTDDLEILFASTKEYSSKRVKDRSKSHEKTNSNSEHKYFQKDRRKSSSNGKEENCDNYRRLDCCREKSKSSSGHSDNCTERYRDKNTRESQSHRYQDKDHQSRKSYRYDHRNQYRTDSRERRKSDESRFKFRRNRSRDRRVEESSDRRKRKVSRRDRSCLREQSKNRNSLEKPKSRSSINNDSAVKSKDSPKEKSSHSRSLKSNVRNEDVGRSENFEHEICQGKNTKSNEENKKSNRDKYTAKNVIHSNLDIFDTKSPLDFLYSEPATGRESNRFLKLGTTRQETEPKEGEFIENEPDTTEPEDWALSFKNERQDIPKPVTLYSKRMQEKLLLDTKKTERLEKKEEENTDDKKPERVENIKKVDEEKEPGELTDDENIVESSKEFQELTKVACIESKLSDKSESEENTKEENELFKEPIKKQTCKEPKSKNEATSKENCLEVGGKTTEDSKMGEQPHSTDNEGNKARGDVIEFSPFKNNYKLIEISPIKPPTDQHVLDYYTKLRPSNPKTHKEMESSILKFLSSIVPQEKQEISTTEEKLVFDENATKTSSTAEEKQSVLENKVEEKKTDQKVDCTKPSKTREVENDTAPVKKDTRELRKKGSTEKTSDEVKPRQKTENTDANARRGKRKFPSQKENESQAAEEKNQKRPRRKNECDDTAAKKPKLREKNDNRKRRTRSTKSDPQPEVETAEKVKEDISFFEFFKPITEEKQKLIEEEKIPVCTSSVTTTMSVTEVVCMETPNKCGEKLKKLVVNEQVLCHVTNSTNVQFSPLIGSKYVEMTPRRMLKNDLMLTDSEDDSTIKPNKEVDRKEELEEEEEEEEENVTSDSDSSECLSDSGASDFVDML